MISGDYREGGVSVLSFPNGIETAHQIRKLLLFIFESTHGVLHLDDHPTQTSPATSASTPLNPSLCTPTILKISQSTAPSTSSPLQNSSPSIPSTASAPSSNEPLSYYRYSSSRRTPPPSSTSGSARSACGHRRVAGGSSLEDRSGVSELRLAGARRSVGLGGESHDGCCTQVREGQVRGR